MDINPNNPMAHLAAAKIVLTPEQQEATQRIGAWYKTRNQPIYRLGGYAGTGKTTIIKDIIRDGEFGSVACAAFTGKAASVLSKKGVPASTIHSLIYNYDEDPNTKEAVFTLKGSSELDLDLIVIDEASMISTELYDDLLSFDIPVLFVGDPGQLEPVGDNPNLMKECDFTLTTIHRQALESPIISLAAHIRTSDHNYKPALFGSKPPALNFKNKVLSPDDITMADQIIVAKNKTRQIVNAKARAIKGFKLLDGVHPTDKLICLRNNKTLGFHNGQILFVEAVVKEHYNNFEMVLRSEDGKTKWTVPVWSEPFYREVDPKELCPKDFLHCDFGYAITCHKAQGSEWPHVIVMDEWMPAHIWSMARWRYTAVTRAATKLTYCV